MSKSLILSAAAILATGIVAALLLPGDSAEPGQDTGLGGLSMPVLVQQDPAPASGPDTTRNAGPSTGSTRPAPDKDRNLRLYRLEVEAMKKELAEKALARLKERHSPEGLAVMRRSLEQRHSELGRFLDLPPEELKGLLDMLARFETERENLDPQAAVGIMDFTPVDGTPMQMVREQLQRDSEYLTQRQEDELRKALGNKYDRWLAYGVAPQVRTSVIRFQDVFGPDANPLSDEQTEAVVDALATEQVRINRDMRNIPRPYSTNPQTSLQNSLDWSLRYASENNRRLVEAASPFLNAEQLVDYREMLEDERNKSIESLREQIAHQGSPRANPRRP